MFHWELCKEWKFGHMTKWYLHKPESILENETTHKILWDFEIQTDHLIPAKRPDQEIIDKKICHRSLSENQRQQKGDKYLDHFRD